MLSLIFAESALELVPVKLRNHPAVLSYAKRFKKNSDYILLDKSWHFSAMKGIKDNIKRGRPDILHICLQAVCGTPLYRQKMVRVYIHTLDDHVILLGDDVSLPKSYHRFVGLFEKLFRTKSIKDNNKSMLEIKLMSLPELIKKIKPTKTIGFSTQGVNSSFYDVSKQIDKSTCLVIGGFQKGTFSEKTKSVIDELYKIDNMPLEAHVVTSRILYEYEKTIFM